MRILGIVCILLFPMCLLSQDLEETKLYLKSGEIYRGILMNHNDTSEIRLKTRAANELIFQKAKVDSMTQTKVPKDLYLIESKQRHYKENGYSFQANLGILAGNDRFGGTNLAFHGAIVNSWVFNPHFSMGLGGAFQEDPYGNASKPRLPLFLNFRGNLLKANLTPYASGSIGWIMPWLIKKNDFPNVNSFEGGRFYQFGLGIRNSFSPKAAYFVEMGFASGRLSEFEETWNPDIVEREVIRTSGRWFLKAGFQF